MSEPRRRRRWMIGVAASAALAADTVLWAVACRRLDDGARTEAADSGWQLEAGPARWGGWPFAAEVTLPDMVLRAGPRIVPPLRWTASRLVLRIAAWTPTRLDAATVGAQSLGLGASVPLPFAARSLVAAIDLTGREPTRIAGAGLGLDGPAGAVRIETATLVAQPGRLSADLQGVIVPGPDGQPVTPPIQALGLDARLTPAVTLMPTASESARAWRAAGGLVALEMHALRWDALAANGQAVLTLDPALQPALTGTVTASGLPAIVARLVETGTIPASAGTAAQAMLVILSAPSGGGRVTLPVAIQDGVLGLARFPLLRVPPLRWD